MGLLDSAIRLHRARVCMRLARWKPCVAWRLSRGLTDGNVISRRPSACFGRQDATEHRQQMEVANSARMARRCWPILTIIAVRCSRILVRGIQLRCGGA